MLGIEYIRAAARQNAPLGFFAAKREGGASSAAARRALRESGAAGCVFPEMLDAAALSRLRLMMPGAFREIQGSGDGLAERAAKYARAAGSLAEAAAAVKTKRYAHSRVRRFLLRAALGLRDGLPDAAPYIRALAANGTGRALLREMRASASLPVITRASDALRLGGDAARMMEIEAAATDLYNLAYPDAARRAGGAEWRIPPAME
jgi:predicted nucleotidyltransferase